MTERQRVRELLSQLNARPRLAFPKARETLEAPKSHGVYIIRNANQRVVHVGRTYRGKAGLYQRLRNHLNAQSSFVEVYLKGNGNKLRKRYTYQYLVVPNNRQRALLENYATAWHCPAHLGLGVGRKE